MPPVRIRAGSKGVDGGGGCQFFLGRWPQASADYGLEKRIAPHPGPGKDRRDYFLIRVRVIGLIAQFALRADG